MKVCSKAYIAFVMVLLLALGAQAEVTPKEQKKIDKSVQKIEKTLLKIEKTLDEAIPGVPLKKAEASRGTSGLKTVEKELKKIQKVSADYPVEDIQNRYQPLSNLFNQKLEEEASPAANRLRQAEGVLDWLEQPEDKRRESASRNRFTEIVKFVDYMLLAKEQDADYNYDPLWKRAEPFVQDYVETQQMPLKHQKGFEAYTKAVAYARQAESIFFIGQARHQDEKLAAQINAFEEQLNLAKKQGPEYFQPTKLETVLATFKSGLTAARRDEFIPFEKPTHACYQQHAGEVVFAKASLREACDPAQLVKTIKLGEPLHLLAMFEQPAVNAYIAMRENKRTLGVPNNIILEVEYKLDGQKVGQFQFNPFGQDHMGLGTGLHDTGFTTPGFRDFYRPFQNVFLDLEKTGDLSGTKTFTVTVYGFNRSTSQEEVAGQVQQVPQRSPVIAEGSVQVEMSDDAVTNYLSTPRLAMLPKGELHDAFIDRVIRALERNDEPVKGRVIHVSSDEITIEKNALGIPLQRNIVVTIGYKNKEGECRRYNQAMAQIFDGTGYTSELALRHTWLNKRISCASLNL